MSEIVNTDKEIQTMITIPLDQNPAAVYLAHNWEFEVWDEVGSQSCSIHSLEWAE